MPFGSNRLLRERTPQQAQHLAHFGSVDLALGLVDARLAKSAFLAGSELTTADIMIVFTLTTMRLFLPFDLAPYPAILAYLQRIGARPAYRRAMQKGDPDMAPLLT